MKLVKFKVQNFRGLKGEHNEIQFKKSDIIFLIGQNNTGKSTFLRAYEFFTNSKQKATLDDFYNQDITNTIKMEEWFELEKDDDKDKSYSKSDPDWATKWVNSDGYIKIKKEWNNINQDFKKYTFSPNEGHWVLNGFGGFDSLFGKAAPTPISINAMEDEASLGEKVNKLIQDQYLKSLKDNHQEQYEKVLQEIRNLQNCVIGCATIQQQDELLNQSFQHVFDGLKLSIEANTSENIKVEDKKESYNYHTKRWNRQKRFFSKKRSWYHTTGALQFHNLFIKYARRIASKGVHYLIRRTRTFFTSKNHF